MIRRIKDADAVVLVDTIDRYLEIEQEAREATVDDPNLETTAQLKDVVDDYEQRKQALLRVRKKFHVEPEDPNDYWPYAQPL